MFETLKLVGLTQILFPSIEIGVYIENKHAHLLGLTLAEGQ
jgi:hypothetical protein